MTPCVTYNAHNYAKKEHNYNIQNDLSRYAFIRQTKINNTSLFIDVDECAAGLDNCDSSVSKCVNIDGSYACECNSGYMQDEETDECVGKKLIISYFSLCFCKYEIYISDDVSACKHEIYDI